MQYKNKKIKQASIPVLIDGPSSELLSEIDNKLLDINSKAFSFAVKVEHKVIDKAATPAIRSNIKSEIIFFI